MICGMGMTLFFVPLASLVLGAVPTALEGVASGANSAFRELGGVLGIAVLGAVFSAHGSYSSGQDYVERDDPGGLRRRRGGRPRCHYRPDHPRSAQSSGGAGGQPTPVAHAGGHRAGHRSLPLPDEDGGCEGHRPREDAYASV